MQLIKRKIKAALRSRLLKGAQDYQHSELICSLDQCTTLYGFGLLPGDWHYIASTMRQYLAMPSVPLEETPLWAYFQKFQPRNMHEALFGRIAEEEGPAREVLSRYRDPERGPMPWTSQTDIERGAHKAKFSGDYGPWPVEDLAERFNRIKQVCDTIRQHGYDPALAAHEDDTIRGVLLKSGNDWKMVILGGNHRACALAALGNTHIPVQADRGLPPRLDVANAAQWPCVRMGIVPESVAVKVALSYFQPTGNRKAEAWGIVGGGI